MKLIALIPFWASFNLEKKAYKNTLLNLTWKVTLQIKSEKNAPVNHFKESNIKNKSKRGALFSECGGAYERLLWYGWVRGWEGKNHSTHYKKLDYTTEYNNIRSLTFLAETLCISQQPADSLLNDSVFWTNRLSQSFINSPCTNIWWICRMNDSMTHSLNAQNWRFHLV